MSPLTKLLFLDMARYHFTKMPGAEYFETYDSLTQEESDRFTRFTNEIHNIWSRIRSNGVLDSQEARINTIWDYHEHIVPVSPELLELAKDYNLDLAEEPLTPEMRAAMIKVLGAETFQRLFGE